ncbi:phosphatidylinositol-3-phosphatase Sac1p [[Candida] anglica]|uniref:Phosphatidylinositol-3-phosphatase Sac1p n=1 Tax=[Candida] anglica TaxID=148631 RepID=A0ABP0E6E8_9ASCO
MFKSRKSNKKKQIPGLHYYQYSSPTMLAHGIAADGTHIFTHHGSNTHLLLSGDSIETSTSLPSVYANVPRISVSGILGTIKLKLNRYVVVVDKHIVTGSVLGADIARVVSTKVIPVGEGSSVSKNEDKHYCNLLKQQLNNATLYFSLGNKFDLTNSIQAQYTATSPLLPQAEFWWNRYLCEDLIAASVDQHFITPAIYGYFKSHPIQAPDHRTFEFALLTRRSVNRAGTRYFRRGIDDEGNVANFNETEQILTSTSKGSNADQIFSFLQIRGSVPVYWAEINNLKYKPNLVISSKPALEATSKHFQNQVDKYGDVYCVNLVNQSGYEEPVKKSFETAIETLSPPSLASKVKYIYFDFHHECRNMRWDRVELLLKHLIDLNYTSEEYFQYDFTSKKVINTQTKIVRTNCMDCLDRTNVVQSTLARWVLQNQFTKAQYLPENSVTPWAVVIPSFLPIFQNFWADNADSVSCAYSGTGALKTDYTRTGQRTKKGALNDLMNSITRYYKNNYADGNRQDSYDLFLGKYQPYKDSVNSPFIDRRPPTIQLLPYLLGTSIFVFFAVIFFPRGSLSNWQNLLVLSASIFFNVRGLLFMNKEGYQFVNWPKLGRLDYLKKVDVFDGQGKSIGVRYEENDDFVAVTGKKQN